MRKWDLHPAGTRPSIDLCLCAKCAILESQSLLCSWVASVACNLPCSCLPFTCWIRKLWKQNTTGILIPIFVFTCDGLLISQPMLRS
ncbi:hypothetical protein B0I35DRAFT_147623 [Stachybotrys elegans]|uniref:Uncharacterized protein n=1 Tax=Stachybotrys elegans TaxID=80388 RepID=A0A8K0SDE5_9HYPO|nr:hypothetical protein B0I35DRAFT_147623 [Stachybotrys elegans]